MATKWSLLPLGLENLASKLRQVFGLGNCFDYRTNSYLNLVSDTLNSTTCNAYRVCSQDGSTSSCSTGTQFCAYNCDAKQVCSTVPSYSSLAQCSSIGELCYVAPGADASGSYSGLFLANRTTCESISGCSVSFCSNVNTTLNSGTCSIYERCQNSRQDCAKCLKAPPQGNIFNCPSISCSMDFSTSMCSCTSIASESACSVINGTWTNPFNKTTCQTQSLACQHLRRGSLVL